MATAYEDPEKVIEFWQNKELMDNMHQCCSGRMAVEAVLAKTMTEKETTFNGLMVNRRNGYVA